MWWAPIDIASWTEDAVEPRGRREKAWLQDPDGGLWLRKQPRLARADRPHSARRAEPAIELLALHLGDATGLEVAHARPALRGDVQCIVSRSFQRPGDDVHPGTELLGLPSESDASPEGRARRNQARAHVTPTFVRDKLRDLEERLGAALVAPFVEILAFDAWIGNNDRHAGNWAVLVGTHDVRFAPMFDPASCLGVELTEESVLELCGDERLLARYIERCGSGFKCSLRDTRRGVLMTDLVADLSQWPEWQLAHAELATHVRVVLPTLAEVLDEIPDDWLSAARKRFAARILDLRARLFFGVES